MNTGLRDIDVIILCGGLGKRIRTIIDDKPKPMASVGGRPFLDQIMDYVADYGLSRFILCTGYKAKIIEHYYQNKRLFGTILFSEEKKPLGTAGALKNAKRHIKSDPFLVMNGDSICKLDLAEFLRFHIDRDALVSIALVNSKDASDVGAVSLDNTQRVIKFREKSSLRNPGNLINAGIYIFNKKVLSLIPEGKFYSLEYDLFPKLDRCYGFITNNVLIDIGTPEGYEKAKQI